MLRNLRISQTLLSVRNIQCRLRSYAVYQQINAIRNRNSTSLHGFGQIRTFAIKLDPVVTFEEVKSQINNGATVKGSDSYPACLLIDCREPHEYFEQNIPTALLIPLGAIEEAFTLKDDDFETSFDMKKPPKDHPIIIHCRSGVRAEQARQILLSHGYNQVANYKGSMLDWIKNTEEKV